MALLRYASDGEIWLGPPHFLGTDERGEIWPPAITDADRINVLIETLTGLIGMQGLILSS